MRVHREGVTVWRQRARADQFGHYRRQTREARARSIASGVPPRKRGCERSTGLGALIEFGSEALQRRLDAPKAHWQRLQL